MSLPAPDTTTSDTHDVNIRESRQADSGLGFSMQEVYQGVSLEWKPVEERGRKWDSTGRKKAESITTDSADPTSSPRAGVAPLALFEAEPVAKSLYPCSNQPRDGGCPRKGHDFDQGNILCLRESLRGWELMVIFRQYCKLLQLPVLYEAGHWVSSPAFTEHLLYFRWTLLQLISSWSHLMWSHCSLSGRC